MYQNQASYIKISLFKYKFNKGDKRFKDVIFCSAWSQVSACSVAFWKLKYEEVKQTDHSVVVAN